MIEFIIIASLALVFLAYLIVSMKEKSYINVLTPALFIFIPANYIFELVHIYYNGYSGSLSGYLFCYLTYALSFLLFSFTYLKFPSYRVKLPFGAKNYNSVFLPYVVLLISFLLYLPILIEYREFILSPREIYMRTRTGYGVNYFLSSTLTFLSFILFLFKSQSFKAEKYIAFILCAILALLHGSKGQVMTIIFIAMLYKVYVLSLRVKFSSLVKYIMLLSFVLGLLFYFPLYDIEKEGFIRAISNYSDYTRNAIMVIDSDMDAQLGRLTIEDTIYSRVPRQVYPAKQKDFGGFYLAKEFYPEWFETDTGSPAFGIGVQYADFGAFSIYYILFWSALSGIFLKIFITRLQIHKYPSDFIMVLFFSGVSLIPLGAGYLLPEHLLLAFLIAFMLRFKLYRKEKIVKVNLVKDKMIINLSRIGKNGTGLFIFSKHVTKCIKSHFDRISIAASKSVDVGCDVPRVRVPEWISMTQAISTIRPILWLLYMIFFFPKRAGRILSTTHHAVPMAKKQIITIHDIRPYFYADSFVQQFYFRQLLPRIAKKVDGILTVSTSTKQLIVECYSVDPEKIYVVPNCIDVSRFCQKVAVVSNDTPYLLMVGATWKHKNAHELIERVSLWSDKYRLKILSGSGKNRESLKELVIRFDLEDKIDFVGYLSESELISLFQNASALVYPSLMEGFGIPPIEAMACGVPVIVSDIPIFREIYGDTPIYVELGKPSSWSAAFELLADRDLIAKKIQDGLQKAKEYTEERMCSALVNAITSIWPDLELKSINKP